MGLLHHRITRQALPSLSNDGSTCCLYRVWWLKDPRKSHYAKRPVSAMTVFNTTHTIAKRQSSTWSSLLDGSPFISNTYAQRLSSFRRERMWMSDKDGSRNGVSLSAARSLCCWSSSTTVGFKRNTCSSLSSSTLTSASSTTASQDSCQIENGASPDTIRLDSITTELKQLLERTGRYQVRGADLQDEYFAKVDCAIDVTQQLRSLLRNKIVSGSRDNPQILETPGMLSLIHVVSLKIISWNLSLLEAHFDHSPIQLTLSSVKQRTQDQWDTIMNLSQETHLLGLPLHLPMYQRFMTLAAWIYVASNNNNHAGSHKLPRDVNSAIHLLLQVTHWVRDVLQTPVRGAFLENAICTLIQHRHFEATLAFLQRVSNSRNPPNIRNTHEQGQRSMEPDNRVLLRIIGVLRVVLLEIYHEQQEHRKSAHRNRRGKDDAPTIALDTKLEQTLNTLMALLEHMMTTAPHVWSQICDGDFAVLAGESSDDFLTRLFLLEHVLQMDIEHFDDDDPDTNNDDDSSEDDSDFDSDTDDDDEETHNDHTNDDEESDSSSGSDSDNDNDSDGHQDDSIDRHRSIRLLRAYIAAKLRRESRTGTAYDLNDHRDFRDSDDTGIDKTIVTNINPKHEPTSRDSDEREGNIAVPVIWNGTPVVVVTGSRPALPNIKAMTNLDSDSAQSYGSSFIGSGATLGLIDSDFHDWLYQRTLETESEFQLPDVTMQVIRSNGGVPVRFTEVYEEILWLREFEEYHEESSRTGSSSSDNYRATKPSDNEVAIDITSVLERAVLGSRVEVDDSDDDDTDNSSDEDD